MATGLARVSFLLLALLPLACGGDSGDSGASGRPKSAAPVGDIVVVLNQQAMLDGRRTAGGDEIRAGAVLVTDGTGAARFTLRDDPADCELRPSSAVEVLPTAELLFKLTKGAAACDRAGARVTRLIETPSSRLEVRDSAISVEETPGGARHRVFGGACGRVLGSAGGAQTLCPLQQTVVLKGKPPQPPTPFDPDQTDPSMEQAVRRLRPEVDKSTTTSTTSRRSPTTASTSSSVPTKRRSDRSP